jgi:hypothetical protein
MITTSRVGLGVVKMEPALKSLWPQLSFNFSSTNASYAALSGNDEPWNDVNFRFKRAQVQTSKEFTHSMTEGSPSQAPQQQEGGPGHPWEMKGWCHWLQQLQAKCHCRQCSYQPCSEKTIRCDRSHQGRAACSGQEVHGNQEGPLRQASGQSRG